MKSSFNCAFPIPPKDQSSKDDNIPQRLPHADRKYYKFGCVLHLFPGGGGGGGLPRCDHIYITHGVRGVNKDSKGGGLSLIHI